MPTIRCVHSQITLAFHAVVASRLVSCFYLLRSPLAVRFMIGK